MNKSNQTSGVPSFPFTSSALIAGCGYVGHRAARLWRSRQIAVSAITRASDKAAQFHAEGISPVVLDLASTGPWPALPDVDTVLWSVGFDRRPGSSRSAAWIDGLKNLLQALPTRSTPRRILYTSSTGVYGSGHGQEMDESTSPSPDTEGGTACLAAENILREFAQQTGNNVFILRLAGIYGPDRLLRRVSELRSGVPFSTAPDDWLNLIHVDDAIRVIDWMANSPEPEKLFAGSPHATGANILNVVAAQTVTRRVYYSELARLVSAPEPVFAADPRPALPASNAASTSTDTVIQIAERRRGGNRRVVSLYRAALPVQFEFDDCRTGLAQAVQKSQRVD